MELSGNYYIGKVSIKRHPSVYWASSTRLPPILSIMRRLRASPNPVPFENVSNLANRSNTKSCLSWGMPMPVSVMQIMICFCLGRMRQLSVIPPSSVNFAALCSNCNTTCQDVQGLYADRVRSVQVDKKERLRV